jgi:hypothetical protein
MANLGESFRDEVHPAQDRGQSYTLVTAPFMTI